MRTPPTRLLCMNRAWPAPAGDHRTRQWLQRVDADWPPSVVRRTKEFSPMSISSWGLIFTSIGFPEVEGVFRNRSLAGAVLWCPSGVRRARHEIVRGGADHGNGDPWGACPH